MSGRIIDVEPSSTSRQASGLHSFGIALLPSLVEPERTPNEILQSSAYKKSVPKAHIHQVIFITFSSIGQ